MSTTILERPITLVRGLFQVRREAENCWSCSAVIYGSDVRFTSVELNVTEMHLLLSHFNVKFDVDADSFVSEFINDCPLERLAQFGIIKLR